MKKYGLISLSLWFELAFLAYFPQHFRINTDDLRSLLLILTTDCRHIRYVYTSIGPRRLMLSIPHLLPSFPTTYLDVQFKLDRSGSRGDFVKFGPIQKPRNGRQPVVATVLSRLPGVELLRQHRVFLVFSLCCKFPDEELLSQHRILLFSCMLQLPS